MLFGDGAFKEQQLNEGFEIVAGDVVFVALHELLDSANHFFGGLKARFKRSFEGFEDNGFEFDGKACAYGGG